MPPLKLARIVCVGRDAVKARRASFAGTGGVGHDQSTSAQNYVDTNTGWGVQLLELRESLVGGDSLHDDVVVWCEADRHDDVHRGRNRVGRCCAGRVFRAGQKSRKDRPIGSITIAAKRHKRHKMNIAVSAAKSRKSRKSSFVLFVPFCD